MTEKNNNEFNTDELVKAINDYADKAVKLTKQTTENILNLFENEKQKAEIRSEVGHTSRDLAKLYEKLGRMYYSYKEYGTAMAEEKDTMELIRTKEKCVELLNEKLNTKE